MVYVNVHFTFLYTNSFNGPISTVQMEQKYVEIVFAYTIVYKYLLCFFENSTLNRKLLYEKRFVPYGPNLLDVYVCFS